MVQSHIARKNTYILQFNMKTAVLTGLVVGFSALSLQAAAQGNAEEGRQKAETCLGCHAAINIENTYPMYRVPKVAGQHADYIESALKAYRSGERAHKTMQANAANLTDEDIADIAAYFEGAVE